MQVQAGIHEDELAMAVPLLYGTTIILVFVYKKQYQSLTHWKTI